MAFACFAFGGRGLDDDDDDDDRPAPFSDVLCGAAGPTASAVCPFVDEQTFLFQQEFAVDDATLLMSERVDAQQKRIDELMQRLNAQQEYIDQLASAADDEAARDHDDGSAPVALAEAAACDGDGLDLASASSAKPQPQSDVSAASVALKEVEERTAALRTLIERAERAAQTTTPTRHARARARPA